MRVTQFNLKIFLSEIESLEGMLPELEEACASWLKIQKERGDYGYYDQWYGAAARNKLESEVMKFREKIATIYDFMGDRGLVNFVPTSERNEDERTISGGGE